MKIDLFLFKKHYLWKDTGGNPCGFRWWWHWTIAFWHLRKWLQYEGMPPEIKSVKEVLEWNRKVAQQ